VRFRRQRLDPQPVEPRSVLLASDGREPPSAARSSVRAALAGSSGVAVLAIAKIYARSSGSRTRV